MGSRNGDKLPPGGERLFNSHRPLRFQRQRQFVLFVSKYLGLNISGAVKYCLVNLWSGRIGPQNCIYPRERQF
jgi:hypothetical protein